MNPVGSLKKLMKKESLDAFLVSKPANVSYLSGFTGDDSSILITRKKDFFITDSRYELQAKKEIKGFDIKIVDGSGYFDFIAGLIKNNRLRRVGFEAKNISYAGVGQFRDRLKTGQMLETYDMVEAFRSIKSSHEVGLIKKALEIQLSVFNGLSKTIKPGIKETDLAAFIEYQMKTKGGQAAAFNTIVLSGKRTAMPHGTPSQKRIGKNELVMVDAGVRYNGYNSDLTRMFYLGKIPIILKRIFAAVKTAQQKATEAIRPDLKASYIDNIAREYLVKHRLGRYFGHSLGHGIGREVHEAPSVSARSKDILKAGMVFTVEPAVYIPSLGGVRIEDVVLVTKSGCEVLS
jgi:Xaa-Pro aminopeptidase